MDRRKFKKGVVRGMVDLRLKTAGRDTVPRPTLEQSRTMRRRDSDENTYKPWLM